MDDDTGTDRALDALFVEAGGQVPSPHLVARVLADAEAEQSVAPSDHSLPAARRGFWTSPPAFIGALGGWGGFGGVTAAGLVGLAVGFWSPDAIDTLSGGQVPGLASDIGWTPDLAALAWEDEDV